MGWKSRERMFKGKKCVENSLVQPKALGANFSSRVSGG